MRKGERIRTLREQKKLTQEELAGLLNTKRQTISKYEKGIVTNIPSDRVEALARILDTTPEYILGWESDNPEEKPATSDGFTENQRKLIDFAERLSDDQAEKVLRLMQSILAFDE